jgi:hypothetical protein
MAKQEYTWIGKSWWDISYIQGLVNNKISPYHIVTAINILNNREINNLSYVEFKHIVEKNLLSTKYNHSSYHHH